MKDEVKIYKALADDTRLKMVKFLLKEKEIPCQQLSKKFPLSQPTMSHHFKKLTDANLLLVRKNGVERHYSINKKILDKFKLQIG